MIEMIESLFSRQVRDWPLLAKGVQGLARAQTRQVRVGWFEVFVRHIPHRAASTTAAVDPESVAKRPCFLCAGNLPPQQEGVPFDDYFAVYCNPFPIVDRHLTIIHRDHRAQRIAGQFGKMLDLAAALPGYFVVYNGPQCGASAPDHMHFQAGSRILFPIADDTGTLSGITVPDYSRNVLVFRGGDRSELVEMMDRAIALLAAINDRGPEPMVNIAVYHEAGRWVVYLFPRAKHRPQAFYTGALTVSPASIDLCGIFVAPVASDFEKITARMIAAIFREVTLPDNQFREIAAKLESRR
jgi:hypothetical protein